MPTSSSRSKRTSTLTSLESLRQCQIAPVSERSLDQLVNNTQILKAIIKLCIGHFDGQLFQYIGLLRIEVETHHLQPFKVLTRIYSFGNQL